MNFDFEGEHFYLSWMSGLFCGVCMTGYDGHLLYSVTLVS